MMSRRRRESLAPRLGAALLLLSAGACGGDGGECVTPPCPLPVAVQLTVRDSASASPLAGASVTYAGPYTGGGPCSGTTCVVLGGAGTYELDVSAPGYRPAHRQVVVAGTAPAACGCAVVETQQLAVALARSG